eukprot:gene19899-21843_t
MEDLSNNQEASDFAARPYQLEILDEGLRRNVIVCLGTGTGKTFISIMLIKELSTQIEGKLNDGGRRTFFLANTVPLVNQQSKAIEMHTNLRVGKYSGDMGVDFWNKKRWEEEFDLNDVLVMTAQILYNMLLHGFLKLSNINLLLLDECHHTAGNHPYAKIMEIMQECSNPPRVMGLTASIINKKPKKSVNMHAYLDNSMKDLECRMRAACVTCADPNAAANFATKPEESVHDCPPTPFDTWDAVGELDEMIGEQLYSADDFLVKLKSSKEISKDVRDLGISMIKELNEIRNSLGLWSTYNAAKIIHKVLRTQLAASIVNQKEILILQMLMTKVVIIERMFASFAKQEFGKVENVILAEPIITGKVVSLMEMLRKRKDNLCAIIFVQRRVTAKVLSSLINDVALRFGETYQGIKSDYVYGHNIEEVLRAEHSTNGDHTEQAVVGEKGTKMTSRKQEKILRSFRNAGFNVLVSTSVVEEGVDIRKCNLVIKFDGISNYREYVQSKGRARAAEASFVVFASKESANEAKRDLQMFQEIEIILQEKSHNREEPTEDEIRERQTEDELIKPFQISNEEGAARITKDNAVDLLHRYCAKLPGDRFTVCKPFCSVMKNEYGEYTGTVRFPINCPLKEVVEFYRKDFSIIIGLENPARYNKPKLIAPFANVAGIDGEIRNRTRGQLNGSSKSHRSIPGQKVIYLLTEVNECNSFSIQGDSMPTKKLAKMSAAQKACIELYHAEELDNNFLPWKEPVSSSSSSSDNNEDDKEDEELQGTARPGTKKSRKTYARKIPNCFAIGQEFPSSGLFLYKLDMVLAKPRDDKAAAPLWNIWYREDRKSLGLLTAVKLPKIPSFPLFTKAGEVQVDVKLILSYVTLNPSQIQSISEFHDRIFREFATAFTESREFSTRLAKQKYLLVPLHGASYSAHHEGDVNWNTRPIDIIDPIENCMDFDFINQIAKPDSDMSALDHSQYEDAVIKRTYLKMDNEFYVTDVNTDMRITEKIAKGKQTFKDYYMAKYDKNIRENQPLLQSVAVEKRINNITPRYGGSNSASGNAKQQQSARAEAIYLVPELCMRKSMPASFHCQATCIPSLLFRLETMLVAEEFGAKLSAELTMDEMKSKATKRRKIAASDNGNDMARIYHPLSATANTAHASDAMWYKDWFGKEKQSISKAEIDDVANQLSNALSGSNSGETAGFRGIPLPEVLQCLTTTKANAGFNLERSETLGDSFLKLATSIALYFAHETANEGRLTEKRKRMVSNKRLAKAAKHIGLQGIIVNTAFGVKQTGKEEDVVYSLAKALWVPPMFKQTSQSPSKGVKDDVAPCQVIADKSLADSIEALIGVVYSNGGVKMALKFLDYLQIECLYKDENENQVLDIGQASKYANFPLPRTALLSNEDSARQIYRANRFTVLEEGIGYSFKDRSFLIQAATHMSYEKNRTTDCYQRLEFLGDAILDFLVISYLYDNHAFLDPSSLTDIKSALVNNNTFSLLSVQNKLHKCLMHSSPALLVAITRFVQQIEDGSDSIESLLKNPFIIVFSDENEEQEGYCAPKVLGDLFESLAGAIFLDSGLDLVSVWRVFFPMLKPLIDKYVQNVPINPVRRLHESYPSASNSCKQLEGGKMKCTWRINGHEYGGIGQNSSMAKAAAAQIALSKLKGK